MFNFSIYDSASYISGASKSFFMKFRRGTGDLLVASLNEAGSYRMWMTKVEDEAKSLRKWVVDDMGQRNRCKKHRSGVRKKKIVSGCRWGWNLEDDKQFKRRMWDDGEPVLNIWSPSADIYEGVKECDTESKTLDPWHGLEKRYLLPNTTKSQLKNAAQIVFLSNADPSSVRRKSEACGQTHDL